MSLRCLSIMAFLMAGKERSLSRTLLAWIRPQRTFRDMEAPPEEANIPDLRACKYIRLFLKTALNSWNESYYLRSQILAIGGVVLKGGEPCSCIDPRPRVSFWSFNQRGSPQS